MVSLGDREVEAVSSDLSLAALHLRLPRPNGQAASPGLGEVHQVRLKFPGQEAIVVRAEVTRTDPEEHDIEGRPVLGLDMRLVEPEVSVNARLSELLEAIRFSLMIAGDDPEQSRRLESLFAGEYRVVVASTAAEALRQSSGEIGLVILHGRLPDLSASDFLLRLTDSSPRTVVIHLVKPDQTALDPIEGFVNLGRIFHQLRQPFRDEDLVQLVARGIDAFAIQEENKRLSSELEKITRQLQRENAHLRQRVVGTTGFENIVGRSPKLRVMLDELDRIRGSDATVHIHGETGCGKELVARALHAGGPRAGRPFVIHNCAGMTETLLQSTLFGHRKGAFTGADREHRGVFQCADGGTLFLDEVAELSPAVQAALLRALQNGEVTPVGSSRPEKVDVRVVSATNKSLYDETTGGRFRADLYFRLVVIEVKMPPLRERLGDVPLLARHFLDLLCERYRKNVPGFTPATMESLEAYSWPGNVRELENIVERAVVLAEPGQKITDPMLPTHLRLSGGARAAAWQPPVSSSYDETLESFSKALIQQALDESGGVVTHAAARLRMERSRLSRMIQRLALTATKPD